MHVYGEAHALHPLYPIPPHCAHCAAVHPPAAAVELAGGATDVTSVVDGFGAAVVDDAGGVLPPPLLLPLQEKTGGPGMVYLLEVVML